MICTQSPLKILTQLFMLKDEFTQVLPFKYKPTPHQAVDIHECVTFMTASVCSSNHPTSACPDSWKATTLCSSLHRILLFFTLPEDTHTHTNTYTCMSDCRVATETYDMCWCAASNMVPAITLSTAYSKLKVWMDLCPSLAACRAASLQMLAMSAPAEKQWNRHFSYLLKSFDIGGAGHYFVMDHRSSIYMRTEQ